MTEHLKLRTFIRHSFNKILSPINLEIRRKDHHDWSDTETFIPFRETVAAALAHGLSVGDYIDAIRGGIPGASQATIDGMAELGVFAGPIQTILEIGPGSGRYIEKTLKRCSPSRYEVYETATPWREYLARTYPVIAQSTDGRSLSATADRSIDLLQAHKVFNGVNNIVTFRYWIEALRVLRPSGFLVFDAITESCLSIDDIRRWGTVDYAVSAYPTVLPSGTILRFFEGNDCKLVGSFYIPLSKFGKTEVFVFRRGAEDRRISTKQ